MLGTTVIQPSALKHCDERVRSDSAPCSKCRSTAAHTFHDTHVFEGSGEHASFLDILTLLDAHTQMLMKRLQTEQKGFFS